MSRKKGKPNDPGGPSPNDRRVPEFMDPNGDYGPMIVLLMTPAKRDEKLPTNPFIIARSVKDQVGTISAAYRDRDGHMVLKTRSEKKAAKLMEMRELIDSTKVKVTEHARLNQTKCIVTCRAVDGLSEEELKEEMADQGVIDVRRLGKGGKSATMVVTVRGTVAPKELFFGYEVCTTREYKQGPMQCFRCYEFGHTKSRCQAEEICRNCSEAHKIAKDADGKTICDAATKCRHCNGAHSSASRSCPKYRAEEEINEIRVKEDKSPREARRLYDERKTTAGSSYAATAANSNNEARHDELKQTKVLLEKALAQIAQLKEAEEKQRKQGEQLKLALEKAMLQIASLTANRNSSNSESDSEMDYNEETSKRKKPELSDSSSDNDSTEETLKTSKDFGVTSKPKTTPSSDTFTKTTKTTNTDKKTNTVKPNPKKPKTGSDQANLSSTTKPKKQL